MWEILSAWAQFRPCSSREVEASQVKNPKARIKRFRTKIDKCASMVNPWKPEAHFQPSKVVVVLARMYITNAVDRSQPWTKHNVCFHACVCKYIYTTAFHY